MTYPDWNNPATWYNTGGTSGSWLPTGTVTWPTMEITAGPAAAKRPAPVYGWKCPDCDRAMAPWVPTHDCEPSGFLAKAEDPGQGGCCDSCTAESCSRCAGREARGPGEGAE